MRKHKFLIFSRKYAQYLVHLILYLSRIKQRKIYLCIIVFDSSLTLQILEKKCPRTIYASAFGMCVFKTICQTSQYPYVITSFPESFIVLYSFTMACCSTLLSSHARVQSIIIERKVSTVRKRQYTYQLDRIVTRMLIFRTFCRRISITVSNMH